MTDSPRLVQRFLDQELSAEERIRFVVELSRSDELRRQVVAMETLAIEAARLPRPAVPEAFVANVLERIAPPHPRTLAPSRPRPLAPSWALAAAACLVFAVAGWLVGRRAADAPVAAPPNPSTVLVRLVVVQPDARTVQVAGDFNGWNPEQTPLVPADSGAWSVMLPLEPGRYAYKFVVDGQTWVADPFAAEQADDGFGSTNAVIDVRAADIAPL